MELINRCAYQQDAPGSYYVLFCVLCGEDLNFPLDEDNWELYVTGTPQIGFLRFTAHVDCFLDPDKKIKVARNYIGKLFPKVLY